MRIRSIKPEFWTDSTMVQLPLLPRLVFIGLWNCADDFGYIRYEPESIAMLIMPREDLSEVEAAIDLLVASDRLEYFEDGESGFMRVKNWEKHQKVDHPTASKIFREGSRKLVIPQESRRLVALKYGCEPGKSKDCECYFCGAPGQIWWHMLHQKQRPSAWVSFADLELSHLESEAEGGSTGAANIVLACRHCNRSMQTAHGAEVLLAKARERSRELETERNREHGKEGKGKEQGKVRGTLRTPFSPPSLEDWQAYCAATWTDWHPSRSQEAHEYYTGAKWKIGKAKKQAEDWRACANTAHKNAVQWGTLQPVMVPPTRQEYFQFCSEMAARTIPFPEEPRFQWSEDRWRESYNRHDAKGWKGIANWESQAKADCQQWVAREIENRKRPAR